MRIWLILLFPLGKVAAQDIAKFYVGARFEMHNISELNTEGAEYGAMMLDSTGSIILFTQVLHAISGGQSDVHVSWIDLDGAKAIRTKALIQINTSNNEGAPAFSRGNFIYTLCPFVKKQHSYCELRSCRMQKNLSVSDCEKLKMDTIYPLSFTMGQATLSRDGDTLIFSGKNAGDSISLDLYLCEWLHTKQLWSVPRKLDIAVNSSGNELFPYLAASGDLYFSSDRAGTDLDIYLCQRTTDGWSSATPLKEPINSDFDDFAFVINELEGFGYLSSNRPGGRGGDDIYFFRNLR